MYESLFWSSSLHHHLPLEKPLFGLFISPSLCTHANSFLSFSHHHLPRAQIPPAGTFFTPVFSTASTPHDPRSSHTFIICLPRQVPSFSPRSIVYFLPPCRFNPSLHHLSLTYSSPPSRHPLFVSANNIQHFPTISLTLFHLHIPLAHSVSIFLYRHHSFLLPPISAVFPLVF